ncbi:MAG: hypothetical protein ACREJO_12065 [Phycisphaerales bacterium]
MLNRRTIGWVSVVAGVVFAGGCTTYYQVNDPAGNRMYYTTDIDRKDFESSGAVRFIDDKTGAQVTLQSSEVKEISEKQYEAAVGKK